MYSPLPNGTRSAEITNSAILAERIRAHALHGDKSMEGDAWDAERRLRILVEEVGELAKVFNERDLGKISDEEACDQAFKEGIQVAAMAAAWAEACDLAHSRMT